MKTTDMDFDTVEIGPGIKATGATFNDSPIALVHLVERDNRQKFARFDFHKSMFVDAVDAEIDQGAVATMAHAVNLAAINVKFGNLSSDSEKTEETDLRGQPREAGD